MMSSARFIRLSPLFVLPVASALAGACSGTGTGDGDAGDGDSDPAFLFCAPADTCPPNLDEVDMTTTVSFSTDIYEGYFRDSCGGGSGCHGRQSNAAAGIYMGTTESPLDADGISSLVAQLTQTMSKIAPAEQLVVPGQWQESWLMTKLDGCQDAYDVECDGDADELMLSVCGSDCGDGMPASEGDSSNPNPFPTTDEERLKVHKVRAWIAQGATDN